MQTSGRHSGPGQTPRKNGGSSDPWIASFEQIEATESEKAQAAITRRRQQADVELQRLRDEIEAMHAKPVNGKRRRQAEQPSDDPADSAPDLSLVLDMAQLHARAASAAWAVKGLVPEQGLGFLFGGSGAFKSFLALDYALHRCYGMRWLGRRTRQAVPVYIAAEGGAGLMRRIDAWHRDRGMLWQDCPMRVVIQPLMLSTKATILADTIKSLTLTIGDVIVDTMSQTFTGNENSNDEVADWLRTLGTELRDELKCTVMVIHHTGHVATERPRGASAIISNVDFAFGIFRDGTEMLATMEFAKVKDSERPESVSFSLTKLVLGLDEDGDQITSLAARHLSTAEDVNEAMALEASEGRGGRNHVLMSLIQNGMLEKDLRKLFGDELDITDPDSRRQAYHRAKSWATTKGLISVADGVVILGRPGPKK